VQFFASAKDKNAGEGLEEDDAGDPCAVAEAVVGNALAVGRRLSTYA
jgi:hypothetical protein